MSKLIELSQDYAPSGTDTAHGISIQDIEGNVSSAPGESMWLLDGDTFTDSQGGKYRLQGALAPETEKVLGPEGPLQIGGVDIPLTHGRRVSEVKAGEAGGHETTTAVNAFLKQAADAGNPFDRVITTGETNRDREVVRMTDAQGRDLVTELYRHGIYKPVAGTDEKYVEAYRFGRQERELGTFEGYEEVSQSLENALEMGRMKDPTTGEYIYSKTAWDEVEFAAGKDANLYNLYSNIAYDDPNRTIDNMATNSVSASFKAGWEGMVAGAYGAAEMLGATTGSEGIEEWGKSGVDFQEELLARHPEINNFNWQDVDGVLDGVQFIANQAAASAPYLGLAASGALFAPAGAAVAGGAGALAAGAIPSATVYAGQIWNDMPDDAKNAGWAIAGGVAAGLIDRFGVQQLIKPTSLLNKTGKAALANHLVSTGKAASIDAANKLIAKESRQLAGQMFRQMGKDAAGQVASMVNRETLLKQTVGGIVKGAVSEGITEATQETIQLAAAKLGSGQQINQAELEDRIRDAIIAGASLGGGLGGAGGVSDYAAQQATIKDFSEAESERLNKIDQINRRLREAGKVPMDVTQILDKAREDVAQDPTYDPELQAAEKEKGVKKGKRKSKLGSFADLAWDWQREGRGVVNAMKNIESIPDAVAKSIAGAGKLVASASSTAFNPEALARYESLRNIRALVGQTRGTINAGASFEAAHDFLYSRMAQQLYMPEIMARFGKSTGGREQDLKDVSQQLREFARDGWWEHMKNGGSTADMPANLKEHAQALYQTANQLEVLTDTLLDAQNDAIEADGGEKVGRLSGWWWKHRGFDAAKVQKNKDAWFEWMRQNAPDMTEDNIQDFYDRITSGEASTIDDYFSHVRGIEYEPGAHKERTAKMSEQEGFDMFGQDDLFADMDIAVKSGARYATNRRYFGAGGKNLDKMFEQLLEEGMPLNEVKEVAWYTKSIIDSATGNFNRINNPRWAAVQKFATTWSIFAGLPLSALSSLPESVMINLGLDKGENAKALSEAGMQVAKKFYESSEAAFKDAVNNNLVRPVGMDGFPAPKVPKEQQLLNDAGLFWAPQSAAKRLGVGETNIAYSWWQDKFFRLTGIANITQAQRRASAAIATDFIANRLSELSVAGDLTVGLTNRQQHVYQQLSELGMDVDLMVELWKDFGNDTKFLDYVGEKRDIPADVQKVVDDNMQLAMYNFVNMRVQNPGAANRPLFFQDPHYQMLTQFNGFVSTFTANIVPKIWNDYIKRGAPQMKYETFKVMLMMVAMGGASQYLKDLLKYGQATPYLNNPQQLQRAIYSGGVLGQYERVADLVQPLYGGSGYHSSILDQAISLAIGEAGPTVRNIGTVQTAMMNLLGEDTRERGIEQAIKLGGAAVPVVGWFGVQDKRAVKGAASWLTGGTFQSGYDYYEDL